MIVVVFGAANRPTPIPFISDKIANHVKSKLIGSCIKAMNDAAATTMPAVENPRCP